MIGIVKWFNNNKGFGFLVGDDEKDYFAHYSNIVGDGFRSLEEGEEVTFDGKEDEKGRTFADKIRKTGRPTS